MNQEIQWVEEPNYPFLNFKSATGIDQVIHCTIIWNRKGRMQILLVVKIG